MSVRRSEERQIVADAGLEFVIPKRFPQRTAVESYIAS